MPKKRVGNLFEERFALPSELGLPMGGTIRDLDEATLESGDPQVHYSHPNGELIVGDCLRWLASLEPESVDLIFADPPYSIGKADWDHFESHDAYVEWSTAWIELCSKVLKPAGSLYICGFSEILADIRRPAAAFFESCRWLVWFYKNKANMTKDWGRSHESILHFRKTKSFRLNVDDVRVPYGGHTLKYPDHPQAESSQYGNGKKRDGWTPNEGGAKPRDVFEIPVTSNGMSEKTPHPTQKPEELLRKLILGASSEGDLVIDPFVGSGTTVVCAEQLGRRWAGCELNPEYAKWAAVRVEHIAHRSASYWLELDRTTAQRRESIR